MDGWGDGRLLLLVATSESARHHGQGKGAAGGGMGGGGGAEDLGLLHRIGQVQEALAQLPQPLHFGDGA